ncbi:glycosyltransferase family 4 protein [Desulfovulcanus ferrireducens]|uniref:glycosyltransferase family 4 protein n=1 Tax=Desulfovulcanus ferrireducens TaxID=2831190 RepID=UPI003369F469
MMLYKLLSRLDRKKFSCRVISLLPIGSIGEKIQRLGIQVDTLNLTRGIPSLLAFIKTISLIRSWRPDIIQTWLYHADLLGLIAAKIACKGRVIWNIRCSNMDFAQYRKSTAWVVKINALFSSFPEAVITNSFTAKDYHFNLGYSPKRFLVIPNGFELGTFKPDDADREKIRQELGISANDLCVGMVARYDVMKDHSNFLRAAGLVRKEMPDVQFILCGQDVDDKNKQLMDLVHKFALDKNVYLLGLREDIPRLLSGLDVYSSSSFGEGFPNVIGEAMACGLPCVVTDVGDCSRIVGDTGIVVPPKDSQALAKGMLALLSMPEEDRNKLGLKARKRIEEHYSLKKIVKQYEQLYFLVN